MPDPLAGLPPRYLRTPEAARFLGLSGRTLEKHRTYGTGPKYRKIGGRVVYALYDLQDWAELAPRTRPLIPGGDCRPAPNLAAAAATRAFGVVPARRNQSPAVLVSAQQISPKSERNSSSCFMHAQAPGAPGCAGPHGLSFLFPSQIAAHQTYRFSKAGSVVDPRRGNVPEHGMATIWDAHVLIWAASQIVAARDTGLKTSRHDGGDTPRNSHLRRTRAPACAITERLKAALDRCNRRRWRPPSASRRSGECTVSLDQRMGRSAPIPRGGRKGWS